MKFDDIKEIILDEEVVEDSKDYTIKCFQSKSADNNIVINYKTELENKGKIIKAASFNDSGDRVIKLYNTDNSITILDSKDLMTIKEPIIKKSIIKAINSLSS